MEKKQGTPKGMILYPKTVVELLHIRRQANKGIPIITVFEVEAQSYKYGKKAYSNIIKKQIIDVLDFTLRQEKKTMPMYYDGTFEKGSEVKFTEVERDYNHVYYYFNHEVEAKKLNDLLEYLQSDITHKDYDHLNINDKANVSDEPKHKFTAKHYALAYIFDCYAKGARPEEGNKMELEKIGGKRMQNKKSGNTFYKAFNEIQKIDTNAEHDLISIAGKNWKSIILDCSEDKKALNEYLKNKQF